LRRGRRLVKDDDGRRRHVLRIIVAIGTLGTPPTDARH
jgi:hypothetical protein